ncbi:MAG TPA: bifunctional oligoribonuclease/PAP phosphatase NrnA [Solirubrobacterales bacterium]|nr:bifunctional oligoribonuclease/PAP phosphatase NrnA [Solirubrobacterales bacterium]
MNPAAASKLVVKGGLDEIAEAVRENQKFLLTTHEGPDGDALGSVLGMHHLLESLGKDSVMFLAAKEFPLPIEYRHLPLEGVFHEAPADISDRIVIFLDCGNIDRMPVDFLRDGGKLVVNIDHHHDNTEFGDLNFVDAGASCTAEIIYELAVLLDVKVSPAMARALYIGIVTDTGKFMYDATKARTHRVAAELIDAGVDVDDVNRRLYESVPIEKLRLLSRALDKLEIHCAGALIVTYIDDEDYRATEAGEEMTEGIIDNLRAVDRIRVAAVIRDQVSRGRAARKISLRAGDDHTDVSVLARKFGGGGHVRAAGCSTELGFDEIVGELCDGLAAQPLPS